MGGKPHHVFGSVLELLTGMWPTPLVRLNAYSKEGVEVWAKLEFYNPFSHSIKDRPVWNMLMKARSRGVLRGKLYEATSGNVGIAMACLANVLGLKFRAYIPKPTPRATEILLKALGADVVRTEYVTIDQNMISMVAEIAAKEGATNLNQFYNDDNFEVHYETTARELDEQLRAVGRSPPDVIVAGVGTSGHIAALSKYFKGAYGGDRVKVVGVVPAKGSTIPGIKRLETGPKWFPMVKVDKVVEVASDEAIAASLEFARREGLLVGLSSGAVLRAFAKVASEYGDGVYVLVFPDDGFKYVERFERFVESGGSASQPP